MTARVTHVAPSAAMAGPQAPPPATAASAPAPHPTTTPSAANPSLAYLNPIDRTAYTKNVVNSHSATPSSTSASSTAAASAAAASAHSATSAASPSAAPLVFDTALLAAPTFDPHTFITTTLSHPPSGTTVAPSLQSLHASLTSYSASLHASLVSLLNSQYESFITLSSSLLPLPPLLSTLEEYAEQVREKTRAILVLLTDKRAEEDGKRREWSVEEERGRWLTELSECVERVRIVQAVMAEVDEAAEAERIAGGQAEEGEEAWVGQLDVEERAVVRRALRANREGAGAEEKKRREEKRQKRREDHGKRAVAGEEDEEEEEDDDDDGEDKDDYDTDDAIKRQHNQAYDLFLSLLSTSPAIYPSSTSQPSLSPSQLYRLTHLTFLFTSLHASMTLMSQFQLISSLQSTVSALYTSFLSHLQRAFLTAVSSASASPSTSSSSSLTSVLRLYVLLDERAACESIVRDQLLVPALQSIFVPNALRTNPSASSGGSAVSNLGALYDRVLELVERVVCVLNEATCAFSPRSFDWFGDVFFTTLAAQLTPLATALFSPGTPTVFHAHYTLSCSLLSSLSALAEASSGGTVSDEQQSPALLSHAAVDGFMKRWNLSIYFRLRFQQLATAVEVACSLPTEQQLGTGSSSGSGGVGGWSVPAVSGVVSSTVLQCWADGVWLAELSGQLSEADSAMPRAVLCDGGGRL